MSTSPTWLGLKRKAVVVMTSLLLYRLSRSHRPTLRLAACHSRFVLNEEDGMKAPCAVVLVAMECCH
jgi:hypothetical protein